MKNVSRLFSLLTISTISLSLAATNYTVMDGEWTGTITTNMKDVSGGGKPEMGATGTPVTIKFTKTGNDLTGTSTVGNTKETWTIKGNEYTWNDGEVTVTSKAIGFGEIPAWVKTKAGVSEKDTVFAFKFSKCTVNKTKKPCEAKKDIPDGIDKTGVWLFKVQGDMMTSNVYYNYSNGGQRILEQSLNKKK